MNVVTTLASTLVLLDDQWIRLGESIVTDTCDLPGHFQTSASSGDAEGMVLNFLRNIDRSEPAHAGKLVTEVPVQRFKPVRQSHRGRLFAVLKVPVVAMRFAPVMLPVAETLPVTLWLFSAQWVQKRYKPDCQTETQLGRTKNLCVIPRVG